MLRRQASKTEGIQDSGCGRDYTPGVAPHWRAMQEPTAQVGGGGAPNQALHLTASSLHSYVAAASGSR